MTSSQLILGIINEVGVVNPSFEQSIKKLFESE